MILMNFKRLLYQERQYGMTHNYISITILPLKVEFKREMAIDEEGPKRKFLRLGLATAMQNNTLFSGTREHRIPTKNASAILSKTSIHVKALSIAQGDPGPE